MGNVGIDTIDKYVGWGVVVEKRNDNEMGIMNLSLKNFNKTIDELNKIETNSKKAVSDTIVDMKRSIPGMVANSIMKQYNIKKSEITPQSITAKKDKKLIGGIGISGNTIQSLRIDYHGRLLTPAHFGMNPKKIKNKSTQITMSVHKEKTVKIGKRNFLVPTGTLSKDKIQAIPFSRNGIKEKMSRGIYANKIHTRNKRLKGTPILRQPLKKFTTVSLPQMVDNKSVRKDFEKEIEKKLNERLNANMKRHLG